MRNDNIVKEYVRNLTDEDLDLLYLRLQRNVGDDLAEVSEFLAQNKEVDKWLGSAVDADEWFKLMERVQDLVKKERHNRQ